MDTIARHANDAVVQPLATVQPLFGTPRYFFRVPFKDSNLTVFLRYLV
jgi:hypothetical protein